MSNGELIKTYGLIDTPINQNLISKLKRRGEAVLIFPSLKAERLELQENQKNLLKNPADFDWIVFTDTFAAEFFIEYLRELGVDFFELDNSTICAAGEAVADRLRFVQVHADVIPSKSSAEAIFSAIASFARFSLEDLRFLVVGGNFIETSLIEKLRTGNAAVEELVIYKAELPFDSTNIKLRTLFKGGAVDEFIFSSPEDWLSLKVLFAPDDLTTFVNDLRISAVSEVVFQSLQEAGLRPLYFHEN